MKLRRQTMRGYSCQLLTDDMVDIFIVDGNTTEDVELQLLKCRESLRGYARTHIQTAITVMRLVLSLCGAAMGS